MIEDRDQASLVRKLRRKTSILSDAEVATAATLVRKALADSFGESVSAFLGDQRSEDIVRWGSLQARCEQQRAERGLSIRDASAKLGIPQYRLRAIESGGSDSFEPETARRYLEFLELGPWLKRWIRQNRELADRAGLPGEATPRQRRSSSVRARHSNIALQPSAGGSSNEKKPGRPERAARRG